MRSGEAWRGSLTRAKRPAVAAAARWALAYVIVWTSGQRFSTAYLDYGWQMLPYDTLRADPLGSVWYLHIQPPLWNLTIGCIGRWSPFPAALVVLTAVVIAVGLGHSWRIIRRRASDLARSSALSAVGLVAGWSFAVGSERAGGASRADAAGMGPKPAGRLSAVYAKFPPR